MSLHWVIFMVVPNSNRVRRVWLRLGACWLLERWLVGLALVCAFVCAFVSARSRRVRVFVSWWKVSCSAFGLFACRCVSLV